MQGPRHEPDNSEAGAGSGAGRAGGPEGIDAGRVSEWITSNVPGTAEPLRFELIAGGRSNLTYEVTDSSGSRFVLRRPPTGRLLPTAHDMAREHRIISALAPAGVPVAPALGLCADPEVTGAPFYLMGFVEGYVLRTPREAEEAFDAEQRRRVSESLVDTLVMIHQVDPVSVGLGDLGRTDGYIRRQLRRWYGQYRSARDDQGGPDVAAVDRVHDRLASAVPEQAATGIVHGDYRLDNTVVAGDAHVAAVLDWEICTLGDTLADLGQLLVYWSEDGERSALQVSATAAAGFGSRGDLVERYASSCGRDVEGIEFYMAFAYWKLACILEGVYTRYVAGAMGDPDFDYSFYPASITDLADRAEALAGTSGRGAAARGQRS